MQEPLKDWLTIDEYAKMAGISKQAVQSKIARKVIDPAKVYVLPKKTQVLIHVSQKPKVKEL